MLRVEVITRLSLQDRIIEEWSELADACAYSTVFQTPEWLATWWLEIGQTQRGKSLHLVAVRDGQELVGLVPLMQSGWGFAPIRRLMFLGAGAGDYNDAIAIKGREDETTAAFYSFLRSAPGWDVLDLRELREGSLLRERPPATAAGLIHSDWNLESCPYLTIPTDLPVEERWERLLSGYSKKMRQNVRYYERALKKAFTVEERVVADPAEIDDAFDALFELHQRRWNRRWLPGVFSNRRVQAFHKVAAKRLLARGWLRLHLLLLDDEVDAALYAFAFHGRTCYYQGGFEPELARYSLGSVLIANAIRLAAQEGFETFDFLRGNEEYKQRWTHGMRRTNIRRLVAPNAVRLAAAERIHRIETGAEYRLKELFAGGIVRKAPAQTDPKADSE